MNSFWVFPFAPGERALVGILGGFHEIVGFLSFFWGNFVGYLCAVEMEFFCGCVRGYRRVMMFN